LGVNIHSIVLGNQL